MPLRAIARMIQTMLYAQRFFPYYVYNILGGIEEDGKYICVLLVDGRTSELFRNFVRLPRERAGCRVTQWMGIPGCCCWEEYRCEHTATRPTHSLVQCLEIGYTMGMINHERVSVV